MNEREKLDELIEVFMTGYGLSCMESQQTRTRLVNRLDRAEHLVWSLLISVENMARQGATPPDESVLRETRKFVKGE